MVPTSISFLNDEQKVHMRSTWEPGDVWDDRNKLTLQAVQELFQPALVRRHSEVKAMDTIVVG